MPTPETGFRSVAGGRFPEGAIWKINKNKGIPRGEKEVRIGQRRALLDKRGRIPIDDLHKSSSEGEGACSRTCAGRSHLPLRGKLGWMTPRAGQKKTGKRNASFGALVPKRGPLFFRPAPRPGLAGAFCVKEQPAPAKSETPFPPVPLVAALESWPA